MPPGSLASLHYYDRQFESHALKLLATEYYVTADDLVLSTVLGSCVAACLYDTAAGVGGMNHFMLPGAGEGPEGALPPDARYGMHAMDLLVSGLLRIGARRDRLVAKVFGGGAVLSGMTSLNIGQRNAAFVIDYLKQHGVSLAAQDLGGSLPRRVCFFPRSGRAAVHRLRQGEDLLQLQQEEDRLIGLSGKGAARPRDTKGSRP